MNTRSLSALCLVMGLGILVGIAETPAPPITSGPAVGATVLWNGHDLSGWKLFVTNSDVNVAGLWRVTNGVLSLAGQPNGYLRTEKVFSNYHFHAEWRWPHTNGNSGVFVHISGADVIWPVGVECQLKTGAAGELIGHGSVDFPGPLINGKKRARITTPSERPIGEWNAYDIFCRGDAIDALVNGVRQNHIEKVSVSGGGIGLQLEGYPVEFRNVWLESLAGPAR